MKHLNIFLIYAAVVSSLLSLVSPLKATTCMNASLFVLPPPLNDECTGAIPLSGFPLDGSCTSVSITTIDATGSTEATCFGSGDYDVWYSFTTLPGQTSLYYGITDASDDTEGGFQLYKGSCPNALTSIGCFDEYGNITGLEGSTTYYLRAYSRNTGISGTFNLYLGKHLQPINDECATAFFFPVLPSDGSCATVTVTTVGATGTPDPTCTGTEDDDVWYIFTMPSGANALAYEFTNISGNTSRSFQVFQGTCSGLVSIGCYPIVAGGMISEINEGTTYYLRVYTQPSGEASTFQLCLRVVPPPLNDDCSGAFIFPDISSDGSGAALTFTTFGATGTPDNSCFGTEDDDVWISFTPPTGVTTLIFEYALIEGHDEVYSQLFSGSCGNLTPLGCYIFEKGFFANLNNSNTYYLRIYTRPGALRGTFQLTLKAPAPNDECSSATPLPSFPLDDVCIPILISPATATRNAASSASLCSPTYADLWYTFSLPSGINHLAYEMDGGSSIGYQLQVFSGNCSGLTSLGCYQNTEINGGVITGLTSGVVYYLRVFFLSTYDPTELCLRLPPANDNCSEAIAFPPILNDGSYVSVAARTLNATGTYDPDCPATSYDVWYTFTTPPGVTSLICNVSVPDVYFQILSGNDCTGLTEIGCYYGRKMQFTTLTGNTTYYMRVSWNHNSNSPFNIRLGLSLNDNCSSAIAFPDIPTDGSCSFMTGSTVVATGGNMFYPCATTGHKSHDVWFTFTMPNVSTIDIEIQSISGIPNFIFQLFNGSCSNLIEGTCRYGNSGSISGLSSGTTYYLRIYTEDDEVGADFSVCLRLPEIPVNDDCAGALAFPDIPLDGSCSMITATTSPTINANDPACMGNEDDDVWFTFTTPPGVQTLLFETTPAPNNITPVLQVFSGECGNLTSIGCYQEAHAAITGLSGGTTYYLRVYSYYSNRGSTDICLRLLLNEECPEAIAFPIIPLDGSCSTLEISTYFYANSTTFAHCEEGEQGDVWYTFTTPPGVTEVAYLKTGSYEDLRFQVFSGNCNDLTAIGCFITSSYGLITGLSGNTTYYLRAYTPFATNDPFLTTHSVNFCLRLLPNDNCSGAVPFPAIPLNGSCASLVGSTIGATGSASASCVGVEDDDLWYTFTTPPGFTTLRYEINNIISISDHPLYKDIVFEIFTNSCGDLISLGCYDPEQGVITGLNGNTNYYMRVYTKAAPSDNVTLFDICLRRPPSNDFCSGAIAIPELPSSGSCAIANVSVLNASPSGIATCTGFQEPDVWYTFTTPLDVESVWFDIPGISSAADAPLLEIFSGNCTNLASLACFQYDLKGIFTGLTGGTTYYLRTSSESDFTLCLQATPVNDVCQHAFLFPQIPENGSFSTVTVNTARATGVNDATCSGGENDDVWFTFKTPPNVTYLLYECENIAGSTPSNFQVFSGSCNQLISIGCYSSANNGNIVISGLTGNTVYYVRAYSASGSPTQHSVFSISLRVPLLNDNCVNATLIGGCDATILGTFRGVTADDLSSGCVMNINSGVSIKGLWYRLIGDGLPVILHTCFGDDTEAGILVYSGSCGSLTCVTGNRGEWNSCTQVTWAPAVGEEYYIFVYTDNSNNSDFTLSLIGGAQCPNVIGQTTVSIADNIATISWPATAGVESYEYVLSTSGSCSTGTVQTTTGNSVSFSGLETNIQYTFCLRSQCSCYDSDFTSITFAIPLSNDYCTTAVPIACGSTITGNTTGALSDSSLGACDGQSGLAPGNGIWYTLPGDGSLITLDLCASTFDTKVHVYSGTCNNSLLCVANNDDACGSQSKVSFLSSPGLNYFILVSGSNFSNGDFNMDVSCVCEEPLTTPWTTTSIGGPQGTAINNHCGRTIDISAEGASPSGSNDQQFFAFQNFCDSLAITTKVNSITEGDFAGIAFRESEAPGSRMVALKVKKGKYVYREVRYTTNGAKSTQQFFTPGHKWLRILRNGNSFIGYSSSDGVNWVQHFSINLAMPSCIDAGLFVESTHVDALAVGAFSNVSMLPSTSTVVTPGGDVPTGDLPTGDGTSGYIIYPNPTQFLINVEMDKTFLDKALTITINNQFGQMMTIRKIDEVEDPIEIFNVQHLPPGVYMMTLRTTGGEAFAKKFVVVR
ncbi:MAG: T9SS type A sorting domain-containing protein [Saprospiraceae bacterium]